MKLRHKYMKFLALALAIILALSPINTTLAEGAVSDNIGTAVIEQTLGDWEDTSDTHSVIGLLRLIIEKITVQLEKLTALETQVANLDAKVDLQTVTLQESIENMGQAANASYNLYVYIPKSSALSDYSGQQVKITSNSGNQNAIATLRDDGTNYSTTLYFNFSGDCQLSYNLLNNSGQEIAAIEPVTIAATGQEQKITIIPKNMTWFTIHSICQANSAAMFGLTTEGTELPGSWYVVGSGTADDGADALQLWRKTNLGNAVWSTANSNAQAYYNTFNAQFGNYAYKSALLSYTDVTTGWLATTANRNTGVAYWLETAYSSGYHWYVYSDGTLDYNSDSYSYGCYPAVWIH